MVVAIADTHAVIWYLADDPRLSTQAKQAFADAAIKWSRDALVWR